jgi:hypothetical protein
MNHAFDPSLAVYDGRTLLGFAVEVRPSRWAVYDRDNRFRGEYPSRAAALDALYKQEAVVSRRS